MSDEVEKIPPDESLVPGRERRPENLDDLPLDPSHREPAGGDEIVHDTFHSSYEPEPAGPRKGLLLVLILLLVAFLGLAAWSARRSARRRWTNPSPRSHRSSCRPWTRAMTSSADGWRSSPTIRSSSGGYARRTWCGGPRW